MVGCGPDADREWLIIFMWYFKNTSDYREYSHCSGSRPALLRKAGSRYQPWHRGILFLSAPSVSDLETMAKIQAKKRHTIRKSQLNPIFSRLKGEIGDSEAVFHRDQLEIVETVNITPPVHGG